MNGWRDNLIWVAGVSWLGGLASWEPKDVAFVLCQAITALATATIMVLRYLDSRKAKEEES